MEAHLAPTQPTQVNEFTTSCEICSGPHDTQYCMKDLEQAFVEYTSSRIDEAGGRGFLAIANVVIDCRMAKIAVGEGITRFHAQMSFASLHYYPPQDEHHHKDRPDDDKIPTEKVSQELVNQMSQTVDEAKLRKLKKGSSGAEKIMMSFHKFPDDDIVERTSRWVDNVYQEYNDLGKST
nr:MAK10-like protein [Tanacetum cinerariifolium]